MAMQPYDNLTGASPIESFEIGDSGDWIAIRFKAQGRRPARTYRYEGAAVITLAELALGGSGLATFIAREQPEYSARW